MDKTLDFIDGLAQSTGLGGTSLEKGKYVQYSNRKTGKINKNITIRLNKIKDILDLDFETNTIKPIDHYTTKILNIGYTHSHGLGSIELTVGIDATYEDMKIAIEKKGIKNVNIFHALEIDSKFIKNNQN